MSKPLSRCVNFLLPAVVFGYAIYANAAMYLTPKSAQATTDFSVSRILDGEAASEVNTLYKTAMPHRDLAVGIVGAMRYALLDSGRSGVVTGDAGWLFTDEEFQSPADALIPDTVRRIVSIRDDLRAQGISLVIVPIPAKADIYSEHLKGMLNADEMASAYRTFGKALNNAGVATVDVRGALLRAKARDQVFLRSDTHWAPAGAEVVATAIAAELKETGHLPSPAIIATGSEPAVRLWGDLTKFITTPEFASAAGLSQEQVPLFRAKVKEGDSQSVDLFGDASSVPVVLVGTSYSANENWSFVDYLRNQLSADVLNAAKEGLGPGVPMVELLESGTLDETRPQMVLWEFPIRYLTNQNLWQRAGQSAQLQKHGSGDDA